jgi:hypothetical protein
MFGMFASRRGKDNITLQKVLLNGILRTAPIVALAREALETLIVVILVHKGFFS